MRKWIIKLSGQSTHSINSTTCTMTDSTSNTTTITENLTTDQSLANTTTQTRRLSVVIEDYEENALAENKENRSKTNEKKLSTEGKEIMMDYNNDVETHDEVPSKKRKTDLTQTKNG